jgi:hypothetical protein
MGRHSPAPFDLNVVELAGVSSVSEAGESRRIPFRIRSRFRQRKAVVGSMPIESALHRGVRGGDGLWEPRVRSTAARRHHFLGVSGLGGISAVGGLRSVVR